MRADHTKIAEYLACLPDDRRKALKKIRAVIRKNLPKGYKEGMQYAMIGYYVPHSIYPDGYHCDPKQPVPFASLASQKKHMALYLFCIYTDETLKDWFVKEWKKSGCRLDMGKSCFRFKSIEDVPLDLIAKAISRVPVRKFLASYEKGLPASKRR